MIPEVHTCSGYLVITAPTGRIATTPEPCDSPGRLAFSQGRHKGAARRLARQPPAAALAHQGQARAGRPDAGRYEDWELEDPAGRPVEEVRTIRDDLDARVQQLLAELAPNSA
jgi:hypothetical protein